MTWKLMMSCHKFKRRKLIQPSKESVSIWLTLIIFLEMIDSLPEIKHPKDSENLDLMKQEEDVTKALVEEMDRALDSDIRSFQ